MDEFVRKGAAVDLTLMLLNLTSREREVSGRISRRASSRYDDEVLQTLARQGLIELEGKAEAVALTDDGRRQAEMLTTLFLAAQEDFFAKLDEKMNERANHPGWFRLRVDLDLWGEGTCWRELLAPAWFTFSDLHMLIQASFLWWDYHLHDFKLRRHGKDLMLIDPDSSAIDSMFAQPFSKYQAVDEADVYLDEVFPRTRKAKYFYDYGDGWEHSITLVEKLPDDDDLSIGCSAGEGDAPPEDVGSVAGFVHFLEAIGDSDHPEHGEMVEWGYSQYFEPFSLDAVNKRISRWGSAELFDEWESRQS